jgi:hypothetical protein
MRIKTQSKLTCIIWVITVFLTILEGTERIYGADQVETYYLALRAKETEIHKQEKTKLEAQLMQKEQQELAAQREMAEIKLKAGGSGTNTPLLVRIEKLRKKADTVDILEEKLSDLEQDKVTLTQQCLETQYQIVDFHTEIGGSRGDTPVQVRARKLSDSLKQGAKDLTEAVSTLEKELYNIPGNDLREKINLLKRELDNRTSALEEMQKVIVEKEEAYSDLYIRFLQKESEEQALDVELSRVQVENSLNREHLMDVLSKQFQK